MEAFSFVKLLIDQYIEVAHLNHHLFELVELLIVAAGLAKQIAHL